MIFTPFEYQRQFLQSRARIRACVAGRRSGKSEIGAIDAIIHLEQQRGYKTNGVDPYLGVCIAPTTDMLRRLSFKKLMGFGAPFNPHLNKSTFEIDWHNGAVLYGISADKPERLEGVKANFIWIDEAFQCDEAIFLEAMARVADTEGTIWLTGSLGVQYPNPKKHWIYKHFKQKPLADSEIFEWATADNPHFPREELYRLKDTLDPTTYRQMFEVSWDTTGTNLVFNDFDKANVIRGYKYDPKLETSVSVDWGWTHPMAAVYFQYDKQTDTVYIFDEIVASHTTLPQLYDRIMSKPYRIDTYYCDIAGTQTREFGGANNVAWFRQPPRNIHFRYRSAPIGHTIACVRPYIKNGRGQRKLYIDEVMCPKTLDGFLNYSYPEKNGIIQTETPVSKDDDAMAAVRYYFVNRHDYTRAEEQIVGVNRWNLEVYKR